MSRAGFGIDLLGGLEEVVEDVVSNELFRVAGGEVHDLFEGIVGEIEGFPRVLKLGKDLGQLSESG